MPDPSPKPRPPGERFETAVSGLAALVVALDVLLLFVARPLHRTVFEGELGLIEMGTFGLLLLTVPIALRGAARRAGGTRAFFVLMALGCLYWAGEEVSWGQTFLHWATPDAWATGNYQGETNLHNEHGAVGTLLNVVPRLTLLTLTILCFVLGLPGTERLRVWLARRVPEAWLAPFLRCGFLAGLAVLAALLNKFRPLGYKDFGETLEMGIALILLQYAWLRSRDP